MSHILHIHLTREIYVLVPPVVRPLPRKKHVTIMNGIHQHVSSFMVFLTSAVCYCSIFGVH